MLYLRCNSTETLRGMLKLYDSRNKDILDQVAIAELICYPGKVCAINSPFDSKQWPSCSFLFLIFMPAENLRSNLPFVTEVRDFLRLVDTSDRKMAKPSYAEQLRRQGKLPRAEEQQATYSI